MRGTRFSTFPLNTFFGVASLVNIGAKVVSLGGFFLIIVALLANINLAQAAAPSKLRIVSMNLCIDFVLERWQNQQFEFYPVAEHHGRIERIMQLKPDMIIAGQFNSPITLDNFRNNGLPVSVLAEPNSFASAAEFYQELANLLEQPELAIRDIAAIDKQTTQAWLPHELSGEGDSVTSNSANSQQSQINGESTGSLRNQPKPRALAMQVNQWSFGGNNLLNELIEFMGFENLAARKGEGLVKVGLEDILRWQPDVLLLEGKLVSSESAAMQGNAEDNAARCANGQNGCIEPSSRSFALANLNLMHKSLRNYVAKPQVQTVYLPSEVSGCMAQRLPEAITLLRQQLERLQNESASTGTRPKPAYLPNAEQPVSVENGTHSQ